MRTLGLVAAVLIAVLLTIALGWWLRRRGAATTTGSPRTVADLVELQATRAGSGLPATAAPPIVEAPLVVAQGPLTETPLTETPLVEFPLVDAPLVGVGVGDAGVDEIGPGEIGPGEIGPGEIGPGEVGAGPPAAVDVDADAPGSGPDPGESEDGTGPEVEPRAVSGGAGQEAPWDRAARISSSAGVVWSSAPSEPARPDPVGIRIPRPRRGAPDAAAAHAAADLALIRTFGTTLLGEVDAEPVVSLAAPSVPVPVPVPVPADGVGQPVTFRVVGRDGTDVADATVTLLDDRGGEADGATSDAEGRGQVRAPRPGSYVLVSTAPGHQPGALAITVVDAAVDADVLLARSASLAGTVCGQDGPIAGARLTLVQDGEFVDCADSGPGGGYRIADLAAGEYGLSVTAAECEPAATMVTVHDQTDLRHDVHLDPLGLLAAPADDVLAVPL